MILDVIVLFPSTLAVGIANKLSCSHETSKAVNAATIARKKKAVPTQSSMGHIACYSTIIV